MSAFRGPTYAGARCLDLLGTGFGLVLLSLLLLGLALAVRLSSPGPALFRSTRVGRNGRPFTLYKFRSMVVDAPSTGPRITAADDPRVTRLGAFLRDYKLDELPQLLNVLKGDMSLVGPRPEDPEYVALYSQEQKAVLDARPGLTGPASLHYRNESAHLAGDDWHNRYVDEIMPAKLLLDLEYLSRRTLMSDLGVIMCTVWRIAGFRR